MSDVEDIKKLLKTDKIVLGADRTLKGLKKSDVKKVYLAKNCAGLIREDARHYAKLSGAEVVELDIPNVELKNICRKPFAISVIGVLK